LGGGELKKNKDAEEESTDIPESTSRIAQIDQSTGGVDQSNEETGEMGRSVLEQ
jgi:hypothetical protein